MCFVWKDGVCNRQIPWQHMVSMASKAEHLAGSPPTLATVRSKDNFFFLKVNSFLL